MWKNQIDVVCNSFSYLDGRFLRLQLSNEEIEKFIAKVEEVRFINRNTPTAGLVEGANLQPPTGQVSPLCDHPEWLINGDGTGTCRECSTVFKL